MDIKASEVVDELKVYWKQISKTENDKSLSDEERNANYAKILKQIAQALDKHNIK